jgi:hypothetical protein
MLSLRFRRAFTVIYRDVTAIASRFHRDVAMIYLDLTAIYGKFSAILMRSRRVRLPPQAVRLSTLCRIRCPVCPPACAVG